MSTEISPQPSGQPPDNHGSPVHRRNTSLAALLPARLVFYAAAKHEIFSWLGLPDDDHACKSPLMVPWRIQTLADLPPMLVALIDKSARKAEHDSVLPNGKVTFVVQPLQVVYRDESPLALLLGFKERISGQGYRLSPIVWRGQPWVLPLLLPGADGNAQCLELMGPGGKSRDRGLWILCTPHAPEYTLSLVSETSL